MSKALRIMSKTMATLSARSCTFPFKLVLVRESVFCVPQNKHPEELEAEDFTAVSPLEFKLASAIKIYM